MMATEGPSITDAEVLRLYDAVVDEYNRTPLATQEGWVEHKSAAVLLHMRAIASYLPSGGLFLDIGTGNGIAARFALKLDARAISVDFPEASGLSSLEQVRLAGAEGYACDILRDPLPLESTTVDCVFFKDVIEHLMHSPKPALLEIMRVLKPGGVCIASTPNSTRLTVRLKVLLGHSNWPNLRDYFNEPGHFGHHHEYDTSEFRFAFEETGFVIESFAFYEEFLHATRMQSLDEIRTQDRSRQHRSSEPMKFRLAKAPLIALTRIVPQLRSNMLLIARKPA